MCCINQDEVGRDSFILLYFDNVPNFDCFTVDRVLRAIKEYLGVGFLIYFLVSLEPLEVIKELFDHGDGQHESKRGNICEQESNSEDRHELGDCDDEEKEVEEELELVEENHRHKGQHVVFLIFDLIVAEFLWRGDPIKENFTVFGNFEESETHQHSLQTSLFWL